MRNASTSDVFLSATYYMIPEKACKMRGQLPKQLASFTGLQNKDL